MRAKALIGFALLAAALLWGCQGVPSPYAVPVPQEPFVPSYTPPAPATPPPPAPSTPPPAEAQSPYVRSLLANNEALRAGILERDARIAADERRIAELTGKLNELIARVNMLMLLPRAPEKPPPRTPMMWLSYLIIAAGMLCFPAAIFLAIKLQMGKASAVALAGVALIVGGAAAGFVLTYWIWFALGQALALAGFMAWRYRAVLLKVTAAVMRAKATAVAADVDRTIGVAKPGFSKLLKREGDHIQATPEAKP